MSEKKHPYLSSQLIAYIGNKRRLLPMLERAVRRCPLESGRREKPLFVDFFAGSGAVSRLSKLLGFAVIANDWEEYSSVLNRAFLGTSARDLPVMFRQYGGIDAVLRLLNSLPAPAAEDRYISRYYAPESTEDADPDRERLFYTRENAERIDAVRAWIEREYPGAQTDPLRRREKDLLLGLLLYEAATHSNTSGVFKAYHRGFGGRGKDALGRILAPVELEYPVLIDGEATVTSGDAEALARRLSAEGRRISVAYLDPPYNQHQYGSNYHLLNTIARNDRPEIRREIVIEGKKTEKGGIRKDWIDTRSPYCYRKSAAEAFEKLIGAIDARHILVSYSTEGIIPFREMLAILGKKGRLDITMAEYTRYRGGKQALTTTLSNVEFVLMVDTEKENREVDTERVLADINARKLQVFLKRPVSPAAMIGEGFVVADFTTLGEKTVFSRRAEGTEVRVAVNRFTTITNLKLRKNGVVLPLFELEPGQVDGLLGLLTRITSISREEELGVRLNHLRYLLEKGEFRELLAALPDVPWLLQKFNDRSAYSSALYHLEKSIMIAREIREALPRPGVGKFRRFVVDLGRILEKKLSVRNSGPRVQADRIRIRDMFRSLCAGVVID